MSEVVPDMAFRVAILDLYAGEPNQGMRCICELIDAFSKEQQVSIEQVVFDVRGKAEVPDLDFDAYISTGGPGSPVDSEGSDWESAYFNFTDNLRSHNESHPEHRKFLFLICHSFQLYCRYYRLGKLSKRKSTSFGVMPVHMTYSGAYEPFFEGLENPFWAVDSRDWQVLQPDMHKIRQQGGDVLCIEKYRPHIKLERCVMAMRFDSSTFGTQFHPEADAAGMLIHLSKEERKLQVCEQHGEEKYHQMIEHLNDPDKIILTHDTIIPHFLLQALNEKLTLQSTR